jgi:hypothetical protein
VKGFIITGFGHSGTRLAFDIFSKHPDFSAPPLDKLNGVREFGHAHSMFISFMRNTEWSADKYHFDQAAFDRVLSMYCDMCDKDKIILFKMPYYPLNCVNAFENHFSELGWCFTNRDKEKILDSFKSRGELINFFKGPEFRLQLKKLPAKKRDEVSKTHNTSHLKPNQIEPIGRQIMSMIYDDAMIKLEGCRKYKKIPFLDMSRVSDSVYLKQFFESIGRPVSDTVITSMISIIDRRRI